jgi:hypothetical protein
MEPLNIRKWRERAEEYRALAECAVGEHTKESMLSMACTYDDLALQEEQQVSVPKPEYYAMRAQECRRLTQVARDANARALFQAMERRWLTLARNSRKS